MPVYAVQVRWVEVHTGWIEVTASSKEEAEERAYELFADGDFDPGAVPGYGEYDDILSFEVEAVEKAYDYYTESEW